MSMLPLRSSLPLVSMMHNQARLWKLILWGSLEFRCLRMAYVRYIQLKLINTNERRTRVSGRHFSPSLVDNDRFQSELFLLLLAACPKLDDIVGDKTTEGDQISK